MIYSVESEKGVDAVEYSSLQTQKGALAVQSLLSKQKRVNMFTL